MLQNPEVAEAHEKYKALLENFKESHKALEELRRSEFSGGEIKKDIRNMTEEQAQLQKRIERTSKKVRFRLTIPFTRVTHEEQLFLRYLATTTRME